MSDTFSLFCKLPPELRREIWRAAIPHVLRPGLCTYEAGCLGIKRLSSSDPLRAEDFVELELYSDSLDAAPLNMVMADADAEACRVAIAWARKHSSRVSCYLEDGLFSLIREFDPDHDVLYVAHEQWDDFSASKIIS